MEALLVLGGLILFGELAHADTIYPSTIFGIVDALPPGDPDGTADYLVTTSDSSFMGLVTHSGRGRCDEAFIEFDIMGHSIPQSATLNLTFYYSDYDLGTGKRVSISTYEGTEVPDISKFGAGVLLGEYLLPHYPPYDPWWFTLSINVTNVVSKYIDDGVSFLGIRIHDPYFNVNDEPAQVALGNGYVMGNQSLYLTPAITPTPVPGPPSILLLVSGLLGLLGMRRKFKE